MTVRFAQQQLSESLKKALKKMVHSETLAHLFVFVSPSIQVATSVAKDFVLEWLGSASPFHPDLLEVKTTGKIGLHTVAGIRGVLDQLSLTPHASKGRGVLIEAADKMLPPTANALLKVLEEPPPRTLIVLTTASPHRILPTILSRSQIIRIPSMDVLEIDAVQILLEYMASQNPAYSTLQSICDDIQKKIEQELSAFSKKSFEIVSKQYGDVTAAAKQEFQQEIEATSTQALQTRSKEVLEAVYLHGRDSRQDGQAVQFLLKAMHGIDAGAELSHMLLWFVSSLKYQAVS
jgi:DNA polymerase III gamma/tau subunit